MAGTERMTSCPRCGADVSGLAVDGLCPACLFRCAIEPDPVDSAFSVLALAPLTSELGARPFGRFELFDVLGHGGMGVVYRARERATGRVVALKLSTPHLIARGDFQHRFQAEMKAAASLDHPHVLPIYEIGECDGLPFFTMKLAEGGSLAARIEEFAGRHRDAAALVAQIARAVDHAHARGILHRDLKPANILLDSDGHPFVSDFGLVKWMVADDAARTASSVAVGAPGYVAPEQVRPRANRAVGPTADVFSLGVVLYELLTGQKPFSSVTLWDAMERIEDGSYAAPRSLAPNVPRDLETICRKCLEGDPLRRYATAGALAADLESFLEGRVIRARPTTAWMRTWKWARRNPWVAGLSAGIFLLLIVGAAGSAAAALNLARARDRAVSAEADAEEKLWQSLFSEARALRTSTEVGHRSRALAALQRAAEIRFAPELRDEAIHALTRTDLRPIAEWTSEIPFGAFSLDLEIYALELPGNICEVRRTSDHATLAALPARTAEIFAPWRFTPDGETLSIIGKGGEAWLWRWRENRVVAIPYPLDQPPVCLEFSPDGKTIAAPAASGGIAVFDLAGRRQQTVAPHVERPWAFAYSPDGDALAVSSRASREVVIVDLATGVTRFTLEHAAPVSCLTFAPSGDWLAAGTTDSAVTLWSLPDHTAHVLRGHSRFCEILVFSPDGLVLASSGYDQTVRCWDVATQRPLAVLTAANASLFFDAAGSRFAIATEDARWAMFEFLTNRVRFDLRPQTERDDDFSVSLALDPTSRLAAVGGARGVRLYDTAARREAAYLPNSTRGRHDVAFDPASGDLFATVGDAALLRWSAEPAGPPGELRSFSMDPQELLRGSFRLAGVAARQRVVALAEIDPGRLRLFSVGAEATKERGLSHPAVRRAVFSPDERSMLVGGWKSPRVSLWGLPELRHVRDLPDSDNAAFDIGHGGRAALIGTPRMYRILDTADWNETRVLPRSTSRLLTSYVDVAPAAPLAVCQWTHNSVRLLDVRTGTWLATIPVTVTTGLDQLELTADGSALAIAGERHVVQWWDLRELNRELAELGLGWEGADAREF